MKIVAVYYQYPLYENGSYIQEQIDAFCERAEKVTLFATYSPKGSKFKKPKNLEIVWVRGSKIPFITDIIFNFSIIFHFVRLGKIQADIINVICARGIPAGIFLRSKLKKPLVVTVEIINEVEKSFRDKIFNRLQKFLFTRKSIDGFVCWSHYHFNRYLKKWGISQKRVSFIPGGINLELFNPKVSGREIRKKYIGEAKKLIVFAKPMYEYNRKSAELLLEAFALMPKKSETKILFGSGEQRDLLEKRIIELKLQKYIDFMEFVPLSEIPKYLAAADLIVLPFTYHATTARSLLEAMSMRKPIIATKMGEISKVIGDKEAILVKPRKTDLQQAMKKLLSNSKLAKTLANGGYKLVQEKYAINAVSKRTIDYFQKIIDEF